MRNVILKNAQTLDGSDLKKGDIVLQLSDDDANRLTQGGGAEDFAPGKVLPLTTPAKAAAMDALASEAGISLGALLRYSNTEAPTAMVAGDSRAAQCFSDATVTAGTWTGSYAGRGWWGWLQLYLGTPFRLVGTAGKGGDTVAAVVSRMHNPQGGSLFGGLSNPGWTPRRPRWLFMHCYVNDVFGAVSVSASLASARQIIEAARLLGTTVVWPTETPEGPESQYFHSAASRQRIADWNAGLQALAVEYGPDTLVVPDCYAAFFNPATGYSWPGLHNDSSGTYVHLNNAGAQLYGSTVAAALAGRVQPNRLMLPAISTEYVNSNDRIINQHQINPLLTGADLASAGVTLAVVSNCSASTKLIPHPDGFGQMVQADITFTAAGTYLVRVQSSHTSLRGSECVLAAAEIRVGGINSTDGVLDPLTIANNLRGVHHVLNITDAAGDGGNANSRQAFTVDTNDAAMRTGWSGTSLTPPYQMKGGGAPTLAQQDFWVRSVGAGSVRVLIGRTAIRRVQSYDTLLPLFGG